MPTTARKNTAPAPKAAPAKTPPTPADKAAESIDFTALTPMAAPAPIRGLGPSAADNPAVQWMRDSWAGRGTPNVSGTVYGKGLQIPIPASENAYKKASGLLRQAASILGKELQIGLGAAITTWENVTPAPEKNGIKQVYVGFAVKTAKAPRKDAVKAAVPVPTPAPVPDGTPEVTTPPESTTEK